MPNCTYRARPGDAESCRVMAEAGKSLCPRHEFMAELKQQQLNAKDANHVAAKTAGVDPGSRNLTRRKLMDQGYVFNGPGACRGCGESIQWFTTPQQRQAPYNLMPHDSSPAVSHFATCSRRNEFRRSA